MPDKTVRLLGDPPTPFKVTDNGDGTFSLAVKEQGAGGSAADFGTAITGEALESGGAGNLGWLSSLRKRLVDRIGEVTANPTANTLLARLKTIGDNTQSILTALGGVLVSKPDQPPVTAGTLSALSQTLVAAGTSYAAYLIQLIGASSPNLAVVIEGSIDGGATWTGLQSYRVDTSVAVAGGTAYSITTTTPLLVAVSQGGLTNLRVRCSSHNAGNVAVTIQPFAAPAEPDPVTDAAGNQRVALYAAGFATALRNLDPASDGSSAGGGSATLQVGALQFLFNGSGYDRMRGNLEGTLASSAARTSQFTSATQINYNGRGVQVVMRVTAVSGTGGLTLRLQGFDAASSQEFNLNAAPTVVTAPGMYVYELYPGIGAASGDVTQRTSGVLPRTWRVVVNHADGSSYTYSIGYQVLN